MKKSAMLELIYELDNSDSWNEFYNHFKKCQEYYLDKEKQQIIEAYENGTIDGFEISSKDYYNNKFKTI